MANMRSTGAIPADLIATLTKLPRLQAQLRDLSQDVAIGIPDAVQEALETAQDALEIAETTKAQPFLLVAASPALPSGRALTVGLGLSTTDGGGTFNIALQAFLVSLSQLSGNGILAKTTAGAQLRSIQAGSSRIEVLNGDGTTGNPAIDIDEPSLDVGNMGGTLGVAHGGTGVTVLSAFSAHNNGVSQSIPDSAHTQVNLSTEVFDLVGDFAAGAWTPPAGRPVTLMGSVRVMLTAPATVATSIFKNGVIFKSGAIVEGVVDVACAVSCIDMPNGTDVYTLRVYQMSGTAQNTSGLVSNTYFQGSML